MKNFIANFFDPLALLIEYHALTLTNKMDRPNKNIVTSAEQKHCHIVETGLALLAHASMPIKFWDDAFLTATYLMNRLPTRVIDNFSPLTRLFNTPPNYTMFKIFGCACWPHHHLIISINCPLDRNLAFFLDITLFTKDINA
jgi:hypothetical protein